ncbi:MAG: hydantoinase/oxoprolinase family protein [Alphaproteobacteria bacterium]|nr:hydantoinase/oxoprolinase family protein [Alphaproteobacteria bacterium]
MATRLAVDIGGTFTDLVLFDDETGETVEGKVPTVPDAPEIGVEAALRAFVPPDVLSRAAYFLHGTTVGLNALLERRGATVGLITSEGFRDVLEIRRGDRTEMYNLFWHQTKPLVPRRLRLEVPGRVLADGTLEGAPTRAAVETSAEVFAAHGVTSVAVCLINAYVDRSHELHVEQMLRDAGFEGGITLSHRISGEYREYERTSTAVIDAFVRGRMAHYLQRLDDKLRELGFRGQSLITRSGGGSMSFSEAEERPFETIMSGPVGGAEGASEFAKALGEGQLITADVGGTSFDTALIVDGAPQLLFEGRIGDMPIQSPWVDVRSIGAGGGSIAYADSGGFMRVGPQSAGADPGPACYGKGGTAPTVTDAAAWLGMLGPGELASGIHLDIAAAETAIGRVAEKIGQPVATTASGILKIAAASMANAMREISVEQGLDPRDMTLLPFGGAGPMMATLLADEMGMGRVIIPPFAGIFSAWGLLGADMVQTASQTLILPFDDNCLEAIERTLADLLTAIRARGETDTAATPSLRLDIRYSGQEHTLSVPVALNGERPTASIAAISEAFIADYARTFGATMNDGLELTSVRAQLTTFLPTRDLSASSPEASAGEWPHMDVWSFEYGGRRPFRILPRGGLAAGLDGPIILTEAVTTTYVDAGWHIAPGDRGEMILERRAPHA